MWGIFLSEPLPIVGLVGRYPANCLMGRMPTHNPRVYLKSHAAPQDHRELISLSEGYARFVERLHTCYSPIRRSPTPYCYGSLPLDLHVLGLSLAFILSQDQTLHCKKCFILYPFQGARCRDLNLVTLLTTMLL